MKEILAEWRQFLTEQEDKNKVQSVVKSIFAANGNVSLPPEDLKLLQRYVSGSSKTDPLGSAQAATALSVYYKANGNDKFARSYGNAAKRLRGLSKYSGNKALTRAVDTFLGADDPVVEKGLYNSKDRPKFAKFIADLAAGVKSSTGIRILDPTLSTKPPEWAKKYPTSYEALQFTADFLASDPISLLSMAIPVGKISGAIRMKLAQGLRKEVSVGLQKAAQVAAKGEEKATQQILKKTVQDAKETIDELAYYVKTQGHRMSLDKAKNLLKLARQGVASFYKGLAYRGLKIIDTEHLLQMIKAPDKTKKLITAGMEEAKKRPGEWISVKVGKGTKLASKSDGVSGVSSWSKSKDVAKSFSTKGKSDLYNYRVVIKTSKGKFIDVHKTLNKHGRRAVLHQSELEVLGIGEVAFEEILIMAK